VAGNENTQSQKNSDFPKLAVTGHRFLLGTGGQLLLRLAIDGTIVPTRNERVIGKMSMIDPTFSF
jgi:hypothetical protein